MGVSKVEFNSNTLIDLTNDTVSNENLLQGATAHDASGEEVVGVLEVITTGVVGEVISYMGSTPPSYYLVCDGSEYQISDYPYLSNHFAVNFGSSNFFGGDGTSTFAVPDLRGEFLRGSGTNSHDGNGSGSEVGVHQDGTRHLYSTLNAENAYKFSNSGSVTPSNFDLRLPVNTSGRRYVTLSQSDDGTVSTYYTSRPTNTSVMYCIRYQPAFMADNSGLLELESEINAVKNQIVPVNNLLATQPGKSLDAVQGKVLDDKILVTNNKLGQVRVYVNNDDKKIHFVDSEGADTVLNFSSRPSLTFRTRLYTYRPNATGGGQGSFLFLGDFVNFGYTHCEVIVTSVASGQGYIVIDGVNTGTSGKSFDLTSNSYISYHANYNAVFDVSVKIIIT